MDYRQNEVLKLENNPELNIGNVTSVNLTILNGGVQSNVIPPLLTAVFDVRLAIDVDHTTFEAMVSFSLMMCRIVNHNVAFQHKTNCVWAANVPTLNTYTYIFCFNM